MYNEYYDLYNECIDEKLGLYKELENIKQRVVNMIREADNGEIHDVTNGLYSLAEFLGVKVERDEFGDRYLAL